MFHRVERPIRSPEATFDRVERLIWGPGAAFPRVERPMWGAATKFHWVERTSAAAGGPQGGPKRPRRCRGARPKTTPTRATGPPDLSSTGSNTQSEAPKPCSTRSNIRFGAPGRRSPKQCAFHCPQVVALSATMYGDALAFADKLMVDPIRVLVQRDELSLDDVKQFFVLIEREQWKFDTLCDIYDMCEVLQCIVFCSTRKKVDWLTDKMCASGFPVVAVHGAMLPAERERATRAFREGTATVMVASDLWGRGLDVQKVSFVVCWDVPADREQYIHRAGRAGRFGRKGIVISFVRHHELCILRDIEQFHAVAFGHKPQSFCSKGAAGPFVRFLRAPGSKRPRGQAGKLKRSGGVIRFIGSAEAVGPAGLLGIVEVQGPAGLIGLAGPTGPTVPTGLPRSTRPIKLRGPTGPMGPTRLIGSWNIRLVWLIGLIALSDPSPWLARPTRPLGPHRAQGVRKPPWGPRAHMARKIRGPIGLLGLIGSAKTAG